MKDKIKKTKSLFGPTNNTLNVNLSQENDDLGELIGKRQS